MNNKTTDTNEIEVRPATDDDIPAIVEIYNYAILHTTATADYDPVTIEARMAWLRERNAEGYAVLAAVSGESVVGWAALNPFKPKRGYQYTAENSVYVHHEHLGRGIGKRLLAELLDCGRQQGLHSIVALIDSANTPSITLHERFGFVTVGIMPQAIFKFDQWLNVAFLQRIL